MSARLVVTDRPAPCSMAFRARDWGEFGPECGEPGMVVYVDNGGRRHTTSMCPRHLGGEAILLVAARAERERIERERAG